MKVQVRRDGGSNVVLTERIHCSHCGGDLKKKPYSPHEFGVWAYCTSCNRAVSLTVAIIE